jgi:hypothetical protein
VADDVDLGAEAAGQLGRGDPLGAAEAPHEAVHGPPTVALDITSMI